MYKIPDKTTLAVLLALGTALACPAHAAPHSGPKAAMPDLQRLLGQVAQRNKAYFGGVTISRKPVTIGTVGKSAQDKMSPMGRLAQRFIHETQRQQQAALLARRTGIPQPYFTQPPALGDDDGGYMEGPAGGQSETAIGVDSTGQHIVIGYNDTRGFSLNATSVSGYAYSDNGGATFTDGGQLPTPGDSVIGTTKYPQVFGDADIKYLGGSKFIYSSIEVINKAGKPTQTMCVSISNDFGHTWGNPITVTAATDPNNLGDSADKEFIDVDPDTGRILISWSNFTSVATAPGGVEIRTAYSDDGGATWSAGVVVGNSAIDGQGSMPGFAGNGSPNAYVVWAQFPSTTIAGGAQSIGYSFSTDNGATWSPETSIAVPFKTMDQVLGNDRVHCFPALAVDTSPSANKGNIYVVYANNDNNDGADIAFQRSTDGGLTFSTSVYLNSRPGLDRPQWFPTVTVDKTTGRVSVFYFDQGIATSGDLMEVTMVYSDDGGVTWSRPAPLTNRPFHAGWGNDTGQPNLGDYNRGSAQGGELFSSFASTMPPPGGFADGQPTSGSMTTPDFAFTRTTGTKLSVSLGAVTFTESGGNGYVDAGDTVQMKLPLTNYVTNTVVSPATLTGITGTLSTSTPGVSVLRATSAYPNTAPGATTTNTVNYVLRLSPTYVAGTPIELVLTVNSTQGSTTLLYTQASGTPVATTLLSQDFSGGAVLPTGWTTSHAGGSNTVPWTVASRSLYSGGTGFGAFHQNQEDGASTNATRFERLFSPQIAVPASAGDVTLDFDVAYNTEDDPSFNILAYDGFTLRVTDFTTGRLLRSVLVEAFESEFTTGNFFHFPKHLPRNSSSAYFQDMSVWAGASNGFKHVHLKLPGMAGSTVQLRWEYTQDANGTGAEVHPTDTDASGVMFTNLVMNSLVYGSFDLAQIKLTPVTGSPGVYKGVVLSEAVAPTGGLSVTLSSSQPSKTTLPGSIVIPAGATTSPQFTVTLDPTFTGVPVTISAASQSNTRTAGIAVN